MADEDFSESAPILTVTTPTAITPLPTAPLGSIIDSKFQLYELRSEEQAPSIEGADEKKLPALRCVEVRSTTRIARVYSKFDEKSERLIHTYDPQDNILVKRKSRAQKCITSVGYFAFITLIAACLLALASLATQNDGNARTFFGAAMGSFGACLLSVLVVLCANRHFGEYLKGVRGVALGRRFNNLIEMRGPLEYHECQVFLVDNKDRHHHQDDLSLIECIRSPQQNIIKRYPHYFQLINYAAIDVDGHTLVFISIDSQTMALVRRDEQGQLLLSVYNRPSSLEEFLDALPAESSSTQ